MKLWIGGEIDASVGDFFRQARRVVEQRINATIESKNYDIALEAWDCIAILREENSFEEITKYNKKTREMDFRLKLDYQTFKQDDNLQREKMIFQMLYRSLEILKQVGVSGDGLNELKADIVSVGQTNQWS